ncbi:MAG: MFS transporter, partial [Pirellulaceae bacterium]|nr:MFS transporter [Pirellulaceae bacterium]
LGAIVAGWLVDRFGSRKLLIVYLLGCAVTCVLAAGTTQKSALFVSMIAMGAFASIYHPAGLALISRETTPENRSRALGLHGIFGSAGIGTAPLVVGGMLAFDASWRQVYWVLMTPGLALGLVFLAQSWRGQSSAALHEASSTSSTAEQHHSDWRSFFTLTLMAASQGFVYSAVLSFLPRYLNGVELPDIPGIELPTASQSNFLAAGVLVLGCIGQYLAGHYARADRLEQQLALVTLCNVPFLVWMGVADGSQRVVAAGLWATIHFMHQPIYNSLIAAYTPLKKRSLCYGFSFAMGLGLGSFGASFAGHTLQNEIVYGTLAGVALVASIFCGLLWVWNHNN